MFKVAFFIVGIAVSGMSSAGDLSKRLLGVWQIGGAYAGKIPWYQKSIEITESQIIDRTRYEYMDSFEAVILNYKVAEEAGDIAIFEVSADEKRKKKYNVDKVYYRFAYNACGERGIGKWGGPCRRDDLVFDLCVFVKLDDARLGSGENCIAGAPYFEFNEKQLVDFKAMLKNL